MMQFSCFSLSYPLHFVKTTLTFTEAKATQLSRLEEDISLWHFDCSIIYVCWGRRGRRLLRETFNLLLPLLHLFLCAYTECQVIFPKNDRSISIVGLLLFFSFPVILAARESHQMLRSNMNNSFSFGIGAFINRPHYLIYENSAAITFIFMKTPVVIVEWHQDSMNINTEKRRRKECPGQYYFMKVIPRHIIKSPLLS